MNPFLNNEFTSAEMTYHWLCAKCGATHVETYRMKPGDLVRLPILPSGWRRFGNRLVCAKHEVTILVDGAGLPARKEDDMTAP